jgi:general secretion pathway protein H
MTPARAAGAAVPPGRAGARPQARHAAAGVTLIELLVVLALMGVIAAMVVPMLSGQVSTTALKSAAREVAAGLRYARSESLATRRETLLVFDLEQRSFRIDRDPRVHQLPQAMEMKLFTAQSDIADEKTGAIRFFPDGGSNGGRVTLAAGERKFEVDVDWLTGRVAILD